LVIPSGNPWLRKHQPTASGADRFRMCELAVAELGFGQKVKVLDIEVNRAGPTYSIETIEVLQKENPDAKFTLILGADAAARISQWHRSDDLKKLVTFLVVNRPGATKSEFDQIEIDAFDISATQVREAVSKQANLSNLISPSVWNFIKERKLYGSK
jgi:nicotinate-nucleotide adenylyltransferase